MNPLKFFVDESKCVKCGACIRDCASEILEFDQEREFPHLIAGMEERCNKCQHCLAICPTGALEIFGRDPEESIPPDSNPDSEEILSLIANRRSFRSYRHENVDKVTLDKLKDMLKFVPTGVNAHSLYFAFIDDVKVMDEFRDYTIKAINRMLKEDPVPPFVARMARYREQLERGKDVIFRGAAHMLVVAADENSPTPEIDPAIALSYFELYAQSLGIGTVWCGLAQGALLTFPDLLSRLKLPKGYKPGCCMLFGNTDLRYCRAIQPERVQISSVK
ncbi:MAG: nitroreductase family protein [Victivallales bacterium]|jgi:NAD-dependent dihydropyrimidine dehydrogenase PreA subunit/nitroreductase|nr:nitroreductase family protein [Victivallales bacterium]